MCDKLCQGRPTIIAFGEHACAENWRTNLSWLCEVISGMGNYRSGRAKYQVVPNIRSCQISDQQNDNSFQIVEGIFPSLFLWTTVVSEDISNVAWSQWTFYLWIQKHICYELWISIMGPMAFPFYWEMKICGKCRAKNLEVFIDWQWWAVWRGTDKFLRLVPILGPRPNIAGIFPANLDLLAAFKKGALSRKTGRK